MANSRFESQVVHELRDIASSARQMGNALVAMGRIFQECLGTDIASIQANIEKLNDLARQMEQAHPGADSKMKIQEWMHHLNAHFELVDPNGVFHDDQVTKDEFWAYMEMLAENKMVRPVKPEPVKDSNQLEIPNLVQPFRDKDCVRVEDESNENFSRIGEVVDVNMDLGKAMVQFPETPDRATYEAFDFPQLALVPKLEGGPRGHFADAEIVQVIDKTDENYLRVGKIEGVDNTTHRARVLFSNSSEGVLVGVFRFNQLAIMKESDAQTGN